MDTNGDFMVVLMVVNPHVGFNGGAFMGFNDDLQLIWLSWIGICNDDFKVIDWNLMVIWL